LRARGGCLYIDVMLTVILSITFFGVATALILLTFRRVGVVLHTFDQRESPESADLEPLWSSIEGLEKRTLSDLQDLRMAVAEGIEHADRSERRVRAVVQSAKRRFEAEGYVDPGVQAEEAALPELDGSNGIEQRMLPLPEDVASLQTAWASVPGLTPTD